MILVLLFSFMLGQTSSAGNIAEARVELVNCPDQMIKIFVDNARTRMVATILPAMEIVVTENGKIRHVIVLRRGEDGLIEASSPLERTANFIGIPLKRAPLSNIQEEVACAQDLQPQKMNRWMSRWFF
jgi:hypothetical protein